MSGLTQLAQGDRTSIFLLRYGKSDRTPPNTTRLSILNSEFGLGKRLLGLG
ncbi:hypothetical protein LC613_23935 [Nostoc sphaeroides CHAB 2801]|uniref:Uncharacterized protein n=1 Tax=Nostoc sphaeroides CCNUC1 TaxID=2653204 RepID=A0A5P8W2Y4_9NOSO|nr:hypothetical protein [Nostoc sphaeroides]MCC5630876.1 hypothetical protein [Nostoc sphaeroides CHAB 2801]QFS46941.1 hypothetical protein GXM_04422 [Nostoc sphaeroides CCNUC1]